MWGHMAPPEVNRGDELTSIDEAMAATSTRHHGPFCESDDPQIPEPDTQVRRRLIWKL